MHCRTHGAGGDRQRIVGVRDVDRLYQQVHITGAGHTECPCVFITERERHSPGLARPKRLLCQLDGARVDTAADGDGSDDGPLVVDPHRFAQPPDRTAGRRDESDDSGPTALLAQQSANPYLGSVSKGTVTAEPLKLSAADAVQRALQTNLGLLLQQEDEATAASARVRALADLLPNLAGSLRESRQVINLEAYGFPAPDPIVGPFNVFDARVGVSQPVIDISAFNEAKAASFRQQAAKYGIRSSRDLVVLVAVNLYLETVAAGSRVTAARAQQETAQALLTQAQDLSKTFTNDFVP